MTSLNPVLPIGLQIMEPLTIHLKMNEAQARARAIELLSLVGITDPERRLDQYPHQFSGGMRQRAVIAMAMSGHPQLIIADEPTTALDVTIQAQILDLVRKLQQDNGMAVLLITHDLGVIAEMSDRVAVMYAGRVVERGGVHEMLKSPLHPYTHALLGTLPRVDGRHEHLRQIPGVPPVMTAIAERCPFIPRCSKVMNVCRSEGPPPLDRPEGATHEVACYNPVWQSLER